LHHAQTIISLKLGIPLPLKNIYGDRMRVKNHIFIMCDPNPGCPRVVFSNKNAKVRDDYRGHISAGKKLLEHLW
jgi:hypothetical protein